MQNQLDFLSKPLIVLYVIIIILSLDPINNDNISIQEEMKFIKTQNYQDRIKKRKEILKDLSLFPSKYHRTVITYQKNIPLKVIYNLIQVESGWNEKAINNSNSNGTADYGLCQLNSKYIDYFVNKYAKDKLDYFDPFNGAHSLQIAISHLEATFEYLSKIHSKEEALNRTILAYNCGLSRVESGNIPKITQAYLLKIIEVT